MKRKLRDWEKASKLKEELKRQKNGSNREAKKRKLKDVNSKNRKEKGKERNLLLKNRRRKLKKKAEGVEEERIDRERIEGKGNNLWIRREVKGKWKKKA